jgi:hypothetical protein
VFQSRISLGLLSELCVVEVEDEEAEETDDAQRIICEVGLNDTLDLGKGARPRVVVCEESLDRSVLEALVWYVHGVRSVGCIRQPIAAVLRVGAVSSILA